MTVGRSILSTRNTYRAFRNVGETAGRMMLTTNGGGIDDYSRAISGLKLPEDLNRMTEISDHYGYFTSPRPRRRTPEHRRNLRADSETSMVTEPAAFEALTKPPSQEAPSHTVIVPASVGLPRRFSIDSFISLAGGRSLESYESPRKNHSTWLDEQRRVYIDAPPAPARLRNNYSSTAEGVPVVNQV